MKKKNPTQSYYFEVSMTTCLYTYIMFYENKIKAFIIFACIIIKKETRKYF